MRDMLEDSINRILADHVTPELLKDAEQGVWPADLWQLIQDNGFTLALVSEPRGGSNLRWTDAYPLVFAVGRHALPLPLVETMLAAWLLDNVGVGVPLGCLTVVDAPRHACLRAVQSGGQWQLFGSAMFVPWGRSAASAVAEATVDGVPHIALFGLDGVVRQKDFNIAREPRDELQLDGVPALAVARLPGALSNRPIRTYGAMMRCAQMAGAANRLVEQSVQYASDRIQFGKPIGKFQAIQQQIAVLASEAAAMAAGAMFAFGQAETAGAQFAIAAAKVRASEGAGKAASIAHAVHGAIGFTYEHTVHFASRRLWSWRSEFGNHAWWSARLGAAICNGEDDIWATVTSGRVEVLGAQISRDTEPS